jgi:hypothetical protein
MCCRSLEALGILASMYSGTVLTNEHATDNVLSQYVTVGQCCFDADSAEDLKNVAFITKEPNNTH